jgi:hypothetical protein
MAYNNQKVFLRISSSVTLPDGEGGEKGVPRGSEIGVNGESTLSPRGTETRIAWAMVTKA